MERGSKPAQCLLYTLRLARCAGDGTNSSSYAVAGERAEGVNRAGTHLAPPPPRRMTALALLVGLYGGGKYVLSRKGCQDIPVDMQGVIAGRDSK